jgi:hypothetical protein
MLKKLGEVKINKSDDYYNKIEKSLEKAGFTLVLTTETTFEKCYIVAIDDEESVNDLHRVY